MLKVMFGGRVGAGNLGVNQRERGACCLALPSSPCIVELCRADSPEHDSTKKRVVCQAWLWGSSRSSMSSGSSSTLGMSKHG